MADVAKRWMSKVTVGMRVKIPNDLGRMYRIKQGDMVEWICDEKGGIKVAVKEMVLREKKAKVEGVKVQRGEGANEKKVKVEKVEDIDVRRNKEEGE